MTETLTPQDEQTAVFLRNQERGVADNVKTRELRIAAAEKAGTLTVTTHDKALEGHKQDLKYFEDEAAKHAEANHDAYVETAKREAEADGHKINL